MSSEKEIPNPPPGGGERVVRWFTLQNRLGLHARAAAALVQLTRRFVSDIRVGNERQEVSGKSIMSVLQLAATQGESLRVTALGPDSKEAIRAIENLISERFGEPE